MKTELHRLTILVLGLATALEKIHTLIPQSDPELKAYLFSFKTKKAKTYFMNLMTQILRMKISDNWLAYCAKEYNKEPLLERSECWDQITEFFTIVQNIQLEEGFDSSCLTPRGRTIGLEIYTHHKSAFDQIAISLYEIRPCRDTEYDFGILFVQKSD